MDDPGPEVCQICGEGPVEKVLYPVAVHFKGSGFYSTDYGRSRKTAKETEDGGDSKPEPKKTDVETTKKPKAEPSKSSDS
jgi:predicted nucleic acid-binding Zn ribbon protein